jgi:7-keto-8-aminopelargonate synthetase-like enzyme
LSHGLVARLANEGYFVTVVTYPAAPLKRSGVRISITRHHTNEDLSGLAQALVHTLPTRSKRPT